MSINSMLSIGKDSLLMNQHALTIVADNIANMNVEGYSKQRVEMETIGCRIPMKGTDGLYFTSMGARIADITRYCNSYLDGQIRDGSTEMSFFKELREEINYLRSHTIDEFLKIESKYRLMKKEEYVPYIIKLFKVI